MTRIVEDENVTRYECERCDCVVAVNVGKIPVPRDDCTCGCHTAYRMLTAV